MVINGRLGKPRNVVQRFVLEEEVPPADGLLPRILIVEPSLTVGDIWGTLTV